MAHHLKKVGRDLSHALIAHAYGMVSPTKSKLQWVRMNLVLRKSILYSYAHNKGTDQTARMRILNRIFVVRCSDYFYRVLYAKFKP